MDRGRDHGRRKGGKRLRQRRGSRGGRWVHEGREKREMGEGMR